MKLSFAAISIVLNLFATDVTSFVVGPRHSSSKVQPSNTQLYGADEFAFKTVSAASKYSGGKFEVDKNLYNLSLEECMEEWTASNVVNSVSKKDGVYLEAKSNLLIYYDKVTCRIKRIPGQGLGIELFELAGGRADGIGITLVSGLVEGSVAEGSGLQPGDSIIDMTVVAGTMELDQGQASMECCDWDKTVEKIGSLPPATDDPTETLLVTVKRLRRKPVVKVTVNNTENSSKKFDIFAGENLRQGLLKRGYKLQDPFAKAFVSGASTEGISDCTTEKCYGDCTMIVEEGLSLLNDKTPEDDADYGTDSDKRCLCRSIVGNGMREGSLTVKLLEYKQ